MTFIVFFAFLYGYNNEKLYASAVDAGAVVILFLDFDFFFKKYM